MTTTPPFSTPFGSREIHRNGAPFAIITRAVDENGSGPMGAEVDAFAREALRYHNAGPELVALLQDLADAPPPYAVSTLLRLKEEARTVLQRWGW